MKKLFFVSLLSLCLGSAFAAGMGKQTQQNLKVLSYDQLRASCENPSQFHAQVPPNKIIISCFDSKMTWVPAGKTGQMGIDATRQIRAELVSDKYHVQALVAPVQSQGLQADCHSFKQVEQTLNIEKQITCSQLLAHKGSLEDFCLNKVEQTQQENFELVKQVDTGKSLNTCASYNVQGIKK